MRRISVLSLLIIVFLIGSLYIVGIPTMTYGEGAYKVEVKKKKGEEAEATVEAVGEEAAKEEKILYKKEGLSSSETSEEEDSTSTAYSSEEETDEEEPSLAAEIFYGLLQVFTILGDFGFVVGYEFWNAPMATRFVYQGESFWDEQATLGLWNFGLAFNMPITPELEIEPRLGVGLGGRVREHSHADGYVKETLAVNATHYSVNVLYAFSRPLFVEIGMGGYHVSTAIELETDLDSFEYSGFLLDSALVTELTLGAGVISPTEWPIRLRAGIQAYYHFADFGDTQGVRMYGTFLFPTGQDVSTSTEVEQ
jgi:hypothetical protein